MNQAELKEFEYGVQVIVTEKMLGPKVNIEAYMEKRLGAVIVQGFMNVFGETVKEVRYPTTGWDVICAGLPQWARRWRFRPHFTVIEARALYPFVTIPDEEFRIAFNTKGEK